MVDDGIITNNRRIVTKSMWFNGTELSALARRALENEQVTYVSHISGHIHVNYPEASIDAGAFRSFKESLTRFLSTDVDYEMFMNFLRDYSKHQKLFQLCFHCQGSDKYIRLEKAFGYEHGSKNRLGDKSGRKLYCEMDEEDLYLQPIDHRYKIDPESELFAKKNLSEFLSGLSIQFPAIGNNRQFISDLKKFLQTTPRLPSSNKVFTRSYVLKNMVSPSMNRDEIISVFEKLREQGSVTANLAFYAGRYMDRCDWLPFLKAVFERNPVALGFFRNSTPHQVYDCLKGWPDESIYDGNRLALPDEVVNFQRGDGFEKALVFIHVIRSHQQKYCIQQRTNEITVFSGKERFMFNTSKELKFPADGALGA